MCLAGAEPWLTLLETPGWTQPAAQFSGSLALFTSCLGLWSESGSGDWTSGSGCWPPGCLTTKRTKRKRKTSGDAVSSSFCSGRRPRCPTSLDPCCLTVSWHNKHTATSCSSDGSTNTDVFKHNWRHDEPTATFIWSQLCLSFFYWYIQSHVSVNSITMEMTYG